MWVRPGLLILLFLLLGCSHYQGPGSLRGPGEFASPYAAAPHVHSPEGEPLNLGPLRLDWPVKDVKLNQAFKPSRNRDHLGIDLGGRKGTPILAAHDGYVVYAGRGYRGYGKMIIIEYDQQWATLYAHLSKISVKEGQVVVRGQTIGGMGRTGRATGVHLHFELMRDKLPVDPMEYLKSENLAAH